MGSKTTIRVPAAKPTFEYQSCTNLPLGTTGSMSGHFTFVEGSMADPTGPAFKVQVIFHAAHT